MPYMKMDPKIQKKANICLYLLMLTISGTYHLSYNIFDFLITLQTPFDLFILPGLFFYWHYKEKWLKEDVNIPAIVSDKRVQEGTMISDLTSSNVNESTSDRGLSFKEISMSHDIKSS